MELMPPVDVAPANPSKGELSWYRQVLWRLKYRLKQLRRKLPYLVWYNDELDVTVTFSQDCLADNEDERSALRKLSSGALAEMERALGNLGIGFDRGMGCDGRDWEWDWSLSGPISIRFRSRATKPELRKERFRPRLVEKEEG